jgi:hypothetical protein
LRPFSLRLVIQIFLRVNIVKFKMILLNWDFIISHT